MKNILILESANWFMSWGYIVLIIVAAVAITLLLYFLLMKNKKSSKLDNQIVDEFINAIGSKDNVESLISRGSRLVVTLKDVSKINDDYFSSHKEISMIRSSNKITFVVGAISKTIEENFNK